jgi:hypothetical protein
MPATIENPKLIPNIYQYQHPVRPRFAPELRRFPFRSTPGAIATLRNAGGFRSDRRQVPSLRSGTLKISVPVDAWFRRFAPKLRRFPFRLTPGAVASLRNAGGFRSDRRLVPSLRSGTLKISVPIDAWRRRYAPERRQFSFRSAPGSVASLRNSEDFRSG